MQRNERRAAWEREKETNATRHESPIFHVCYTSNRISPISRALAGQIPRNPSNSPDVADSVRCHSRRPGTLEHPRRGPG